MDTRSPHARRRSALMASVLLTIALAVVGCGSLGALPGRVEQPRVLTTQDVDRYPRDSPARSVLEWWRALQFDSPALAARYYSPRLGLTPNELERYLKLGPGLLKLHAGVRVVQVEKQGRHSTVLIWLTQRLRHPNGRTDVVRTPASFDLVKQHGRWLLADNRYVVGVYDAVKTFVVKGTAQKRHK
jgi:hypothetical protein